MTVRIDIKKDRERMEHLKEGGGYVSSRLAKELVLDESYKDNKKRGYIYESPDSGKTIYRREIYDDISGVKLDKNPDQLEFEFPDQHTADLKRTKKIESIFDKLNALESQVREIRRSLIELG